MEFGSVTTAHSSKLNALIRSLLAGDGSAISYYWFVFGMSTQICVFEGIVYVGHQPMLKKKHQPSDRQAKLTSVEPYKLYMHLSHNGSITILWSPQNQISRLQRIQNTAARVVTLSRKSCHITPPILKELHWLPVSQRIVFKLIVIVHKSVNNIAPIYISELHVTPKRTNFKTNLG